MARQIPDDPFTAGDLEQLRSAGISPEEAHRQVEFLRRPTPYAHLERLCSSGDGIAVLSDPAERESLTGLFREAASRGRCTRFVPASGAATRMFRALLHYLPAGDLTRERINADARSGKKEATEVATFLDGLERFAFAGDLRGVLADRGEDLDQLLRAGRLHPILDGLLSQDGLGYAGRPKALLKFHADGHGGRTPLEEHLAEAAALVRDGSGRCPVHFTVSPAEERLFRDLLATAGTRLEGEMGVSFQVGFSHQKPSTDTLAVDPEGNPFRKEDGSLLLRPSGHGALLENLDDLRGDIVLIKNIDNVAPDRLKAPTLVWSRILGGLALRLRERTSRLLERLRAKAGEEAVAEAMDLAATAFSWSLPPGRPRPGAEEAAEILDRPIRVCGMVVNTGEPGGGPFWVRDAHGIVRPQIVEKTQVDRRDPRQSDILDSSTHSNPVFIACSVRSGTGEPYELPRFLDPGAVIVTEKSHEGRPLKALERPGLWNGAMAGWNTVFVEVPLEVFNPVKTVNDLLRPAHQPGS